MDHLTSFSILKNGVVFMSGNLITIEQLALALSKNKDSEEAFEERVEEHIGFATFKY
jgi:hypothetical protein